MKNQLYIVLISALLLTACGNRGSEYVGKWRNVSHKEKVIEILKKDDQYLLSIRSRDLLTGKMDAKTLPLKYVDDTLKFEAGPLSATLTYIKSSGHLSEASLMGAEEYERFN